jgi:hypothetical protein
MRISVYIYTRRIKPHEIQAFSTEQKDTKPKKYTRRASIKQESGDSIDRSKSHYVPLEASKLPPQGTDSLGNQAPPGTFNHDTNLGGGTLVKQDTSTGQTDAVDRVAATAPATLGGVRFLEEEETQSEYAPSRGNDGEFPPNAKFYELDGPADVLVVGSRPATRASVAAVASSATSVHSAHRPISVPDVAESALLLDIVYR